MKINLAEIVAKNRADMLTRKDKVNMAVIDSKIKNITESDLIEIKGVGQATVKTLLENGIRTQEQLKNAEPENIKKLVTNFLSYKAIDKFINNS